MEIKIQSKNTKFQIIPIFNEKNKINFFNNLDNKLKEEIKKEIKDYLNFEGKENQTQLIKIRDIKILLIGIKKDYTTEDLRKVYSQSFKISKQLKEKEISILVPKEIEKEIKGIIEGIDLTNYKFDKYLSKKEKEYEQIFYLNISSKFSKLLKETLTVNQNVKIVRDLVNENTYVITPIKLEEIVKNFANKNKLKFKSLNEKEIQKEKLNLLHSVGKGSTNPPRLIICEYNGNPKSKEKIALVGKGITFDTGGINLKPTGFLEDMKSDMGGAATVYGIFKSAVELKLKKNLILVMSCAENGIDGNSFKPGDVIVSYNGISVEIGNTDAEGRLVLADAISYLQKKYSPSKIIDMATLTGACLVALGPSLIAMYGNNKETKNKIFESGELTNDKVWELPIYDEHRDLNKSKIADIKNIGGRYGGSITAAAFIEKFVNTDKIDWIHLDIAGAARSNKEEFYTPDGGTGRGVRLLIEYLKE